MTPEARAEWNAMLARHAERKRRAAELAAAGRPLRLCNESGRRALAGPDMAHDAPYRVTWFDDIGPWGHECYNTLAEAIYEALTRGYEPQPKEQRP